MSNPSPPPNGVAQRSWDDWNLIRRLLVKHTEKVVGAGVALLIGWASSCFIAIARTPAQTARNTADIIVLQRDVKPIASWTWVNIARDCMALSYEAFLNTTLPCGEAFNRFGMQRTFTPPAFTRTPLDSLFRKP